jgi:HPt (histidine-containing phosphotransfer) domain-containing protein
MSAPLVQVLDLGHLREVTLDDPVLMREVLNALIDDISAQQPLLGDAVSAKDGDNLRRLAHFLKHACANCGAMALEAVLGKIERQAICGDFNECSTLLATVQAEIERLRAETIPEE